MLVSLSLSLGGAPREETVARVAALVDAAGSSSKDAVQTKATWRCHWNRAGDALRLASIRSENYEEVKARVAGGKWFVDCTGSVLADSDHSLINNKSNVRLR